MKNLQQKRLCILLITMAMNQYGRKLLKFCILVFYDYAIVDWLFRNLVGCKPMTRFSWKLESQAVGFCLQEKPNLHDLLIWSLGGATCICRAFEHQLAWLNYLVNFNIISATCTRCKQKKCIFQQTKKMCILKSVILHIFIPSYNWGGATWTQTLPGYCIF